MIKPFPYFGGKHFLVPKLLQFLRPHTRYVEVFGGGASLLFGKPKSDTEVYNDVDTSLVDFFTVLQSPTEFESFQQRLKITPYARELYQEYLQTWEAEQDRPIRVAQWYLLMVGAFAGRFGGSWGQSKVMSQATKFKSKVDSLPRLAERFRDVIVENESWEVVLDKYDSADSFFYLDPPYAPEARKGGEYKHEMDSLDHERLVERIKGLQGKCLLSGYPNTIYERLGWHHFETDAIAPSLHPDQRDGVTNLRTEGVWMNYEPLFTKRWN